MKAPSRLDRSYLAQWWWSIDRVTFLLVCAIMVTGLALVSAAGPTAASRKGIADLLHFPVRQMIFFAPAVLALVATSMLSALQARRAGVLLFATSILMMVFVLIAGGEINGAKRWISIASFTVQPSEFAKPGFIIAAAWMLAEGVRRPGFPGAQIAMALYVVAAGVLLMQPDYGQALLLTAIWALMFFVAGWSWLWIVSLGFVGVGAISAGYMWSPHVSKRIDAFLNPAATESYQVDKSLQAFQNGGLFGRSPEAPPVKPQLPDAHTDFIFAVAVEDFGLLFALALMGLLAALVIRLTERAARQESLFAQCAVAGLAAMVAFQSLINIGVSVRALPAKGMTLPFISYGGSSLIAMALSLGLALALTRRQGAPVRRKDIMP